jgi:hypothetical protein
MNIIKALNNRPAYIWIGFYLAINIAACFLILNQNKLLGEAANIDLHNTTPVVLICLVVLLTYLLILGPLFNRFFKLPATLVPSVPATQRSGRDIGLFLLCLQSGFILFVLSEGVFVAGSSERSTSLWSQFFVFFSCDTLFLLYYAYYRDNRLCVPNLLAVIVSSLLRGWIGIFMTLAILESIRLFRRRQLSKAKIAAIVSLILLLFPFLQILKLGIRASAMGVTLDYSNLISSLSSNIEIENFINIFYDTFQILVDRLQILSQNIVIFQNSEVLFEQYQSGHILPFWLDGIHGVAYHRFIGDVMPDNLGVHLAKLLDPLNIDVNWNSNPGLLAWILIYPGISPVYVLYIFFVLYVSLIFIKGIRHRKPEVTDLVWFSWLAYLIPGWTGSLYLFLHSTIVFYLIHLMRRMFVSRALSFNPANPVIKSTL